MVFKKTTCPYCGYKADRHETLDNRTDPKESELSFCIKCGEVGEYYEKGIKKIDINLLNKETKEEINKITDAWLTIKRLKLDIKKIAKVKDGRI